MLTYDDFTPYQQAALVRATAKLYHIAREDPALWAKVQAQKELLYKTGRLQRPENDQEV